MPHEQPSNSRQFAPLNNAILGLIIVTIFSSWAYLTFGGKGQVPINEEKLAEEVRERMTKNSAEIQMAVESLVAESFPPLSSAISNQLMEDRDRYIATLKTQGSKFANSADDIFIEAVKAEYGDYLQEHREVLAEEFPDHADDESLNRLIAQFEEMGRRLIDRYQVEQFADQAKRTRAAWKNIQPLETPGPDEPSLETQLHEYAVDWTVLAFTQEAEDAVLDEP